MLPTLQHQGQSDQNTFMSQFILAYKSSPTRLQAACDVPQEAFPVGAEVPYGRWPTKKNPLAQLLFLLLSACTNSSHISRMRGFSGLVPPRIKKKGAEGAEDAEPPQAPRGRRDDFYGPKINLAKFRKFWDFFGYIFFKNIFSIEKCLSVQSAFSV